jgi:predicted transcriptional regulator of viral defense system
MNWTQVLSEEARRNCFIRTDDLAKKYALDERVVRNTLRRYESKGLVEHVAPKIYINHFNQQFSPRDLANVLRRQSYISLESALVERGIISQNPSSLLCVTLERPQSFKTKSVSIIYRRISPDLYWGYEEKSTRYNKYLIAEPEKALLDWIYLTRQEGLPTALDEFQLQFLSAPKLRDYAARFPGTVNNVVKDLLLDNAFPPENTPAQRRHAPQRGRRGAHLSTRE